MPVNLHPSTIKLTWKAKIKETVRAIYFLVTHFTLKTCFSLMARLFFLPLLKYWLLEDILQRNEIIRKLESGYFDSIFVTIPIWNQMLWGVTFFSPRGFHNKEFSINAPQETELEECKNIIIVCDNIFPSLGFFLSSHFCPKWFLKAGKGPQVP